jgi:hypothetical protein
MRGNFSHQDKFILNQITLFLKNKLFLLIIFSLPPYLVFNVRTLNSLDIDPFVYLLVLLVLALTISLLFNLDRKQINHLLFNHILRKNLRIYSLILYE